MDAGKIEVAYGLLSAEARSHISKEDFKRIVRVSLEDTRRAAAAARTPIARVELRARVRLQSGDVVDLMWENDRWRVTRAAVDLYGHDTPEEALATLLRAYRAGRFDVILRLVPQGSLAGDSDTLTAEILQRAWMGADHDEIESKLRALKAGKSGWETKLEGNLASISYGGDEPVRLIREDGVWKIQTF